MEPVSQYKLVNFNNASNNHFDTSAINIFRTNVRTGKKLEGLRGTGWIFRVREMQRQHRRALLFMRWHRRPRDDNKSNYHDDKFSSSRRMQKLVRKQPKKLGEEMQVGEMCWMFSMFYKTASRK
jgi:hypothetical protein